ncbi:hypothetical protein ACYZTM_19885 [Pseudomonas sp. MDT2-39-1]
MIKILLTIKPFERREVESFADGAGLLTPEPFRLHWQSLGYCQKLQFRQTVSGYLINQLPQGKCHREQARSHIGSMAPTNNVFTEDPLWE